MPRGRHRHGHRGPPAAVLQALPPDDAAEIVEADLGEEFPGIRVGRRLLGLPEHPGHDHRLHQRDGRGGHRRQGGLAKHPVKRRLPTAGMGGQERLEDPPPLLAATPRLVLVGRRRRIAGSRHRERVAEQEPAADDRMKPVGLTSDRVVAGGLHLHPQAADLDARTRPAVPLGSLLRFGLAVGRLVGLHGKDHRDDVVAGELHVHPPRHPAVASGILLQPPADGFQESARRLGAGLDPAQHHPQRRQLLVPPRPRDESASHLAIEHRPNVGRLEPVLPQRVLELLGREAPFAIGLADHGLPQTVEPLLPHRDRTEPRLRPQRLEQPGEPREADHHGGVGRKALPGGPLVSPARRAGHGQRDGQTRDPLSVSHRRFPRIQPRASRHHRRARCRPRPRRAAFTHPRRPPPHSPAAAAEAGR